MSDGTFRAARVERFHWSQTRDVLAPLAAQHAGSLERLGRWFEGNGVRVFPPLVLPWSGLAAFGKRAAPHVPSAQELAARARLARLQTEGATGAQAETRASDSAVKPPSSALANYLRALPAEPPLRFLVLMQAGAVSLGVAQGSAMLATKTLKRYVVRGVGRAQGLHLRTKGKSRYGSRLRLQNAQLLAAEVHDKLRTWRAHYGAPQVAYVSAPERLFAEFLESDDQPPFGECRLILGIPLDVDVPCTETLLEVDRALQHGRIEFAARD